MSFSKKHFNAWLLLRLALLTVSLAAFFVSVNAQGQEEPGRNSEPKTGAISGHVVNETGQPIPHAVIYITAQMTFSPPRITTTDDGGNFQVSGLDALVYAVGASAPSYISTPRDPDSPTAYYRIGDSVTLNMIKGGVITGTVTSPTGEPLVQAGVRALLIRDANGKPPSGPRFPTDRTTDDRGVYRIYGLPIGTYLVSAGGRGINNFSTGAYETDAPTFAPSSTRDTAAEIVVRAGEEVAGVDIRYRGDPGHAISGIVNGPSAPNAGATIALMQIVGGLPQMIAFSFQSPTSKGFVFYGVGDGVYDLVAQSSLSQGEGVASEARRITVKGADITGVELVVKGLATITGHLALEASTAPECKNKRQPLLSETLLIALRGEKSALREPLTMQGASGVQGPPDKAGDFVLRNLAPGQVSLNARFFAKYWYLRSITRETPGAAPARDAQANRRTDVARAGIALKIGERVGGLVVTLAEGAASLRGTIKPAANESVPAKLFVYLVPAEKENAEDVLRFFAAPVDAAGAFAFNNVPPGNYFPIARVAADAEPHSDATLREPEEAATRAQLRRTAEAANKAVEFKPCQNVVDYQLPFKILSPKN